MAVLADLRLILRVIIQIPVLEDLVSPIHFQLVLHVMTVILVPVTESVLLAVYVLRVYLLIVAVIVEVDLVHVQIKIPVLEDFVYLMIT